MRWMVVVMGVVGLLCSVPGRSRAQQGPVVSAPDAGATAANGRWSFGGGVGTSLYTSDFGYGLSGQTGSAAAGLGALSGGGPIASALVERTLTPRLRLGASLRGTYSRVTRTQDPSAPTAVAPDRHTSSGAGAAVSLRWVLNPGDLVEISPMLAPGANWGRQEGATTSWITGQDGQIVSVTSSDTKGYGFDARVALVVEYRLLTRLYLRLESQVARMSYDRARSTMRTTGVEAPATSQRNTSEGIALGLGLQPMLQLRILL